MSERHLRIALYSHDTMGLGHMRRNLLLAETLAAAPERPAVLLISGSREISRFPLPRGVDCLSLPSLYKDSQSRYHARSLDVPVQELVAVRSTAIAAALEAFRPDVFIVDNVPRGAQHELDRALARLRQAGRTRCILGLRDVLDEPEQVQREWTRSGNVDVIRRHFEAIWVYGDAQVNDVAQEYGFPRDIASRVTYTGYLDQRGRSTAELLAPEASRDESKLVLCMVGGGQDGSVLAEAFAAAPFPDDHRAMLVTGPMMSDACRARVNALAERNPRLEVATFADEPSHLIRRAAAVIAMGGYNTVCDILTYAPRALIVPRVHPREEQLIRAERLAARGLLDVLHPSHCTPEALAQWVAGTPRPGDITPVRMHTATELHAMLAAILSPSAVSRASRRSIPEVRCAS